MEAKSSGKVPRSNSRVRTGSFSGGWSTGPGEGSSSSNMRGRVFNGKGTAVSGSGVTGWQDGSGIGSGLARPDVDGCVLRRKSWSAVGLPASTGAPGTGAGNTNLSELIPRFLRLSALVAMELGNEARDEEIGEKGVTDGVCSIFLYDGTVLMNEFSSSPCRLLPAPPLLFRLPGLHRTVHHESKTGNMHTCSGLPDNGTCF